MAHFHQICIFDFKHCKGYKIRSKEELKKYS